MKTLQEITSLAASGGAMAVLLSAAIATPALAQRAPATPEQRAESREDRRQRIEQMTPEQRQQYFQQRTQERLKSMTPEERQRWEERRTQMQQMQRQQQIAAVSGDDRQRYLMQSAGITDATVQDAIIAFVNEQAQKRQPVTEEARKLSDLMADANATPEAITTQLETLGAVSKEFRTWKEGALRELDAKINYNKDSRLRSLLVLVGILGYENTDAGGFNAIFPKGLAGAGDIVDLLPKAENDWFGGGPRNGAAPNNGVQNTEPAN